MFEILNQPLRVAADLNSSAMAQDYVLHGDFVQFTGFARCKACQAKDLKCALQQSDEGCMACAGANRVCIFTRTVEVSAVKPTLVWETLLHGGRKEEVVALQTPAPSTATSTTPFHAGIENWQPRQAKMSEPTNEPTSVAEDDEEEISIKPDARTASPPETVRSGIDPRNRIQLADTPSLADQERQRELVLSNTHVRRWLDEGLSDSMEYDPQRAWIGSVDAMDMGSGPDSQSEPMRRTQSPSDIAFPNTAGGVSNKQSPTLEAHPWLESLQIPSLENTVSQPATSNQAMWRFARRANSIETASRFASEGGSRGVVDEQHLGLLLRSLTFVGREKIIEQLQGSSRLEAGENGGVFEKGDNRRASLGGLANSGSSQIRPYVISQHGKAGNDSVLEFSGSVTSQAASLSGSFKRTRRRMETDPFEERSKPPVIERGKAFREGNAGHVKELGMKAEAVASEPTQLMSTQLVSIKPLPRNSPRIKRVNDIGESSSLYTGPLGYDDFKNEILRPYPRILGFLLERLTQEQVRRYEKLSQLKDNHARMRQQANCPSGTHCLDQADYSQWVETALNGTTTNVPQSPNHWTPL